MSECLFYLFHIVNKQAHSVLGSLLKKIPCAILPYIRLKIYRECSVTDSKLKFLFFMFVRLAQPFLFGAEFELLLVRCLNTMLYNDLFYCALHSGQKYQTKILSLI